MKCTKPDCKQINHHPNLSSICYKCRLLEQQNIDTQKDEREDNLALNIISHPTKILNKMEEEAIIFTQNTIDSELESEFEDEQGSKNQIQLEWNPEPWQESNVRHRSMRKIQLRDDLKLEEQNLITVDKFFSITVR